MFLARALMRASVPPKILKSHERRVKEAKEAAICSNTAALSATEGQPGRAINEPARANTGVARATSKKNRQAKAEAGPSTQRNPSKTGREMAKILAGPLQDEASTFLVDKHILSASSPYFAAILDNSPQNTIDLPTTTPETFGLFISWLYNGGTVRTPLKTTTFAENLLLLSLATTITNKSLQRAAWAGLLKTKAQFADYNAAFGHWEAVRGSVARFWVALRYADLLARAAKKGVELLKKPEQEEDLEAFLWDVTLSGAVAAASGDKAALMTDLEVFLQTFTAYV